MPIGVSHLPAKVKPKRRAATENPVVSGSQIRFTRPAEERSVIPAPVPIMSQAIIDPEQVRRFAAELKRFNGDLRERTASLMARFTALGDTWQDQEQEKFAAEFTQLIKTLKTFLELSERHTPYLLRKAERIQQYLDQR